MVMLASSLFSGVLVAFVAQAMRTGGCWDGGMAECFVVFFSQKCGIYQEQERFYLVYLGLSEKGVKKSPSLLVNHPFPSDILAK